MPTQIELDVPGTTRLIDDDANGESLGSTEVSLFPVPSSDPEDPLNWSLSRKNLQLACVILYTTTGAISSSCLYSVYVPLSESTGLSIDQLNSSTGYTYLFIGIGALFFQPLSLAIGKRPVYLLTCLVSIPLTIWTIHTRGISQWLPNRLLLGFFGAPLFTLGEVSICDVFFYHQRAWPMGGYVALLCGGACVGPLMGGYVYQSKGWEAVIYITAGLLAFSFVFLFLFLEETNFERHLEGESRTVEELNLEPLQGSDDKVEGDKDVHPGTTVEPTVHLNQRMSTRWKGPKPFAFAKPSPLAWGIIWRGFVQPFALLRLPIVLWCGLQYGIYQIYYNLIAALSSGVLAVEPYNFSTGAVGLTFLAPLLAVLPGAIFGGWVTDKFTLREAHRNNGISEAEHRLKLFVLPTILTPIGLLMLGLGPYYGAHWIVYVLGAFTVNVAGPLATLLCLTYAFDSYHSIHPRNPSGVQAAAQQTAPYLLSVIFLAMVVTFGFNYVITPWAFEWGLKNFAISAACASTALNATVLVILKWGKTLRMRGESWYNKVINW